MVVQAYTSMSLLAVLDEVNRRTTIHEPVVHRSNETISKYEKTKKAHNFASIIAEVLRMIEISRTECI